MPGTHDTASAAGVTRWLHAWRGGDQGALGELTEAVYGELRRLARRRLKEESAGHSLQPTELVHEAFVRLAGSEVDWQDRVHFFAVVATTMRRVLVDHARAKGSNKRGGEAVRVTLEDSRDPGAEPSVDLLALDQALDQLARLDGRQARLVELYYFTGMTLEEISAATDMPVTSAHRLLRSARAWIHQRLCTDGGEQERDAGRR